MRKKEYGKTESYDKGYFHGIYDTVVFSLYLFIILSLLYTIIQSI